jgi:hypothetical protein
MTVAIENLTARKMFDPPVGIKLLVDNGMTGPEA